MRLVATVATIACLTLSGCTQPHLQANLPPLQTGSGHAWAEALEITTDHYRIVTNAEQATAEKVGTLLETVYAACEELFGPAIEPHGLLTVYAFSDRRLYEEQIAALKLPFGISSGIYSPSEPAGIYLPLVDTRKTHPFFTLVHEGVHQYLNETSRLAIAGTTARLPSVPLWLSEGLALYLEAALVDSGQLQPGRVHTPRLQHLQRMIARSKAPEVKRVLSTTYGEPFGNADYSVAWGLVYLLRHDVSRAERWPLFWTTWQETSRSEAGRFSAEATNRGPVNLLALQQEWAEVLSQLSIEVFQEQVIGADQSWSTWQEHWQAKILQLTSQR